MLTPKKECYKLRNRTIVTKSNTPDLDTSIPFEDESQIGDEGIMGESVPDDIAQQESEALLEQIKQLQVRLRDLCCIAWFTYSTAEKMLTLVQHVRFCRILFYFKDIQ